MCAVRMISPSSRIASLSRTRPAAIGRLARKINGSAPAGTNGTRSIPGEFALPACTSGVKPSASRAAGGQRIPIGMRRI
jgi:hypothetical protein